MLMDTGADVSLLPRQALARLGLDGSLSTVPVVRAVEQEYGIVGRNVLDAVPLVLDGPHLTWGEHGRTT